MIVLKIKGKIVGEVIAFDPVDFYVKGNKRQKKKRTAFGRRVQKINQMKAERTWDTGHRNVSCLRDCHWLGACCDMLVLWVNGRPWPDTKDPIEAQQQLDNYHEGALPFELLAHGSTTTNGGQPTGQHAWYLRCKMVKKDGLCGIYEQRPEVCRSFVPGKDTLCVKHRDHTAALGRFMAGMGERITETSPGL